MDDSILFFSNNDENATRERKAVLALNNQGAEKWLAEQYATQFRVTSAAATSDEALEKIKETAPDLLIIARASKGGGGIPDAGDLLARVKKTCLKIDIILIAGERDEEGLQLIGIAEKQHVQNIVSCNPGGAVTIDHMKEAIQKVFDRWAKSPAKVILVASWKGGAGATTVTANLAVQGAKNKRVLAIDAAELPGLDQHLGLDSPGELTSVHKVDFLPASHLEPDEITEIIALNMREYELIIIDAGTRAGKLKKVMEEIDVLLVVADQSPDCIRSSRLALMNGVPKEKAKLVVNKFDLIGGPPEEAVEEFLAVKALAILHEDHSKYLRAASEGMPVALQGPGEEWAEILGKL